MRYVVIGAGAIGGTIGARLHEAGRDVLLIARGPHLAAIRKQGLCLDEPGRSRTLRLPAVGHVSEVGWEHNDVVLQCTKTQDSESVLDALLAVAPGVPVICAQNGVANERFAASRFAEVQAVCVMLPAEHLMPGRVVAYSTPTPGILDVGGFPHGVDRLTEQIVGDVSAAGFSSRADSAIMRWKYRKLLSNLGNAAEAVCGGDDRDFLALDAAARAEGERCLAAAGIAFASIEEDRQRRGDLISLQPVGGRSRQGGSTWQSLQRRTGSIEADFLNGEIVALGQRYGVATPINLLLQQTAAAMAQNGEQPGGRRAADLLVEAGR
ncbi:MAG: ketopantoate reductase family protein [Pseudonocardiaceae bacterium]